MRPRGFSIGFGPPLAKVRRNDIDYAFRAVPLGGYVTIPGMTRPQASDVDAFFGGAIRDAPELVGPAERLKRALAADDFEQARVELDAFEAAAAENESTNGIQRGVSHVARQPLRGRVLAAADLEAHRRHRGRPRDEPRLRGRDLRHRAHVRRRQADDGRGRRIEGRPAQEVGLQPGDRILEIDGAPVTPSQITERISGSEGGQLMLLVLRDGERVMLGPVRARARRGRRLPPGLPARRACPWGSSSRGRRR